MSFIDIQKCFSMMKSFYWKLLLSHIGLQGRGGCLHTSLHLIFLITRGFLRAWEQPIKKKKMSVLLTMG